MTYTHFEYNNLFMPILGNIYTSEKFPEILYDKKAIEVKHKLPSNLKCISLLVQYNYLSGAIRAKKIDEKIDDFLCLYQDGIIVELGCRLSTACYRNDTDHQWYIIDSKRNIDIRKNLFKTPSNVAYIDSDLFEIDWLDKIIADNTNSPILVVCAGISYYLDKNRVTSFLTRLYQYENVEIIFDAVNHIGRRRMCKFYKYFGIKNYKNIFYLNKPKDLNLERTNSTMLDDESFFEQVKMKRFKPITALYMKIADLFKMINIYHIKNA